MTEGQGAFHIEDVVNIELGSLFATLAVIELADRIDWTPEAGRPKPWPDACRAILALLSLTMTRREIRDCVVPHMQRLQDQAIAMAR